MDIYKLKSEGFGRIKKGFLLSSILGNVIFFIIFFTFIKSLTLADESIIIFCALIFVVIITGSFIKTIFKISKMKREWNSFEIEVSEDKIVRKQLNRSDIVIPKNEIVKINEVENSGVAIYTSNKLNYLFISKDLEFYDEFKLKLLEIRPIESIPVNMDDKQGMTRIMLHKRLSLNSLIKKTGIFLLGYLIFAILFGCLFLYMTNK